MPHATPLIATIVGSLALAFVLGALAQRVKISPLVGYLLAGVAVGPFTPGYVADQGLALELSEIGVILLMFGVGLHFSLKDLLSVKAIAIPGAVIQIAFATVLGWALAWALGWSMAGGIVFGLALSVASTVVLLRALQERHALETDRGRIAIGWLIVEDLVMVLVLVLLPPFGAILTGGEGEIVMPLLITLGKVTAFIVFMLVVGRRVIPWILHYIAHTGSRELFRLAVLAIALGVAFGSAMLFGVSFALGAFFAGMVLAESELSHRAAEESLPLRDAFAVLFFVSVGMLFDPMILVTSPFLVLATCGIIIFGKSVAAFLIVRAFRHPTGTALIISASLAQIGEFSFILAALGVDLNLLPPQGRDLILAGAILSILANPLLFAAIDRMKAKTADQASGDSATQDHLIKTSLTDHTVVVGGGRVGKELIAYLKAEGLPFLVIEDRDHALKALRGDGVELIAANAADPLAIAAANMAGAKRLFVAIDNAFEAGQAVEQARKANPSLEIIARAFSCDETQHLQQRGANRIVVGAEAIAQGMLAKAFKEA
ncbi:YbaL family putative K(+) efflux transporter [Dongia rigui]|uniref:YbaL family putative K(+) efflux transporter n=1 Tax=Dongia rigui TaxID=940149 RepID=A0ABU5DTM8_9PROT|nr:YbaL family putative K(+) efflux transporter [Dongia rigui]MDY0870674.1 YbaL family putative K(+) efflux transporter [Dongia rigui]